MSIPEVITKSQYRERINPLLSNPSLGKQSIPGTRHLENLYQYSNCHGTAMYVLGAYDADRPLCFSPYTLEKILESEPECEAQEANLVFYKVWETRFRDPSRDHSAIVLYDRENGNTDVATFEQSGLRGVFRISTVKTRLQAVESFEFYVCEHVFYKIDVNRVKRDHIELLAHNGSKFAHH